MNKGSSDNDGHGSGGECEFFVDSLSQVGAVKKKTENMETVWCQKVCLVQSEAPNQRNV